MTGSHIDTVRTGGRFDGNLGVLAGLEVLETLDTHEHRDRAPGRRSAFFTDEEGARFAPDMLGSLVFVGGMALEEALDVAAADDGARLGDELTRIGYAGPAAVPATAFPHAFVELHIEQGPILEDEGVDDRRRHRRAGHLVDRGHDHRPVGPRRHDADADASRSWLCRGRDRDLRARPHGRAGRAPGGDRRAARRVSRTWSTSCPRRRRSRSISATPTRPCCRRPRPRLAAELERVAAAERVRGGDPLAGPLRTGRVRPRHGRPRRGGRRRGWAAPRGGCRAAPATTRRCWRGSARRR